MSPFQFQLHLHKIKIIMDKNPQEVFSSFKRRHK